MTENKAPDTSVTSAETNINYSRDYCVNRLPCGYCLLLCRACPMYCSNTIPVEPTWKLPEIICKTESQT